MKKFYVTYTFNSKEDRENFIKDVQSMAKASREEKGCVRYDYFYPVDSETEVFLFEQWENDENQERHTKTAHFAKIGHIKEKYKATTKIVTSKTTSKEEKK